MGEVERLLGRPLTDQEHPIATRLLEQGYAAERVAEALRATEKPVRQASDDELRTVRFEALQDGTVRRIE
jgi:hypothetical protein